MKRITMMLMAFALTPLMALATTLSDGLVAHYKFDGNANDSSENANDGEVHGATLTTDRFGNEDSAYSFDGNDWIEAANSISLQSVTNAMTYSAWVKLSMNNGWIPILCKGKMRRDRQFGFELAKNEYDWFFINDGNGTGRGEDLHVQLASGTFVEDVWYHIAASYDGKEMKAYINGKFVGSTAVEDSFAANTASLFIGKDIPDATEYYKGSIDDIRIYNRTLSASEIDEVYQEEGGEDPLVYRTVTFDANGGTCATESVKVSDRAAVGELPTATRSNYTFLGWFTAAVGGEQVSSETVVTADVTWYAQWHEYSTAIIGAKCSIDIGLKGYATKTLPKGLTYNSKTGLVTGTCKAAEGEYKVTFTKKGAVDIVLTFVVRAEKTPTIVCEGLAGGAMIVGVAGGAFGGGTPTLPIVIDAESGVKSVTATKLPTGMKIASSKDKTEWYITGAPTKAGTYEVAITLTTAAGNKVTEKFTVTVAALPSGATGTFNGFVVGAAFLPPQNEEEPSSDGGGRNAAPTGETLNYGTLQVTVSDVGKITAKVVVAAGTYSFTATGWDSVTGSVYYATMKTKKGDALTLACDSTAAWNAKQMTGTFTPDAFETNTSPYVVEAQKNAFGKQWFFKAELAAREDTSSTGESGSEAWTLSFAENAKAAALTVSLNADGKTSVAGTLYGAPVTSGNKTTIPSYKVSASGYADVSGIADGAIFADFAPVISVKSGKTSTKKVLSLRTNLWFDKKNEHEEGVGSAVFAP